MAYFFFSFDSSPFCDMKNVDFKSLSYHNVIFFHYCFVDKKREKT